MTYLEKYEIGGRRPVVSRRWRQVDEATFKQLLTSKAIRGASLQDVEGLHHQRSLYRHPRTGKPFVEVKS